LDIFQILSTCVYLGLRQAQLHTFLATPNFILFTPLGFVFNLDVFVRVTTFPMSRVDIENMRKVVSFQKLYVILLKYQLSRALSENKTCNQSASHYPYRNQCFEVHGLE